MKKEKKQKITLASLQASINDLRIDFKADLKNSIEDVISVMRDGFSLMITKTEFNEFKDEMYEFKSQATASFLNIDSKFQTVDTRLDSLEKTIEPIPPLLRAMEREFKDHDTRLVVLEGR